MHAAAHRLLPDKAAGGGFDGADQIVAAMRKNNKPVEYIVFPDEGHGFRRPENRLKFYAAAEAFLAKYLGGRAEPPSDAEKVDDLRK